MEPSLGGKEAGTFSTIIQCTVALSTIPSSPSCHLFVFKILFIHLFICVFALSVFLSEFV